MKPKYLSLFGLELMEYFCTHSDMTEVAINNIYSVEPELQRLFGVEEDGFNFSFSTISRLIPRLETVLLCELKLETMEKDGEHYIECIRKWIENPENENLERIAFCSEKIGGPQDAALASLVEEYRREFGEMGWALRYRFNNEGYHNILAQRLVVEDSKSTKNRNDEGVQSNIYELKVDGAAEFVHDLAEERKMEFALSMVQSTLHELFRNQSDLRAIIEGIDGERNTIRYRLAASNEMQLKQAIDNIDDMTLEVDHVEFESKVFFVEYNTMFHGKSLAERIQAQEAELIETARAEKEMKRKLREAELRAKRDRSEKERMEFDLKKQEHAQKEERLLTAMAMKEKQREIEEIERRMKEQQRKMREEKEQREREEAERLAEEQRVRLEKMRRRVTRIDALKQYLVKRERVEQKEVDILSDIISEKAYDSDTLLLSEQWMTSDSTPLNAISCTKFISAFLHDQQRMFFSLLKSLPNQMKSFRLNDACLLKIQ